MADPQFLFQDEDGNIFPLIKLGPSDRVLIQVDSQAATKRVKDQIEEHYPDMEGVIVLSNPDPDLVSIDVVQDEIETIQPGEIKPTEPAVDGSTPRIPTLTKPLGPSTPPATNPSALREHTNSLSGR